MIVLGLDPKTHLRKAAITGCLPTILRALSCKAMSAKAYASQIVDELSAGDGGFDALWKSRKETESVLEFPLSAK